MRNWGTGRYKITCWKSHSYLLADRGLKPLESHSSKLPPKFLAERSLSACPLTWCFLIRCVFERHSQHICGYVGEWPSPLTWRTRAHFERSSLKRSSRAPKLAFCPFYHQTILSCIKWFFLCCWEVTEETLRALDCSELPLSQSKGKAGIVSRIFEETTDKKLMYFIWCLLRLEYFYLLVSFHLFIYRFQAF